MMASSAASNGAESSRARKSTTTTTTATTAALHPPEHDLKCPRCDSPNTKFCYYNNYSLTQPRHFCKTCRRYWTKGGALRNVPVGGGCRKNKKSKSSASASSSSPSSSRIHLDPFDPITGLPEPSYGGGLKFLAGLSPAPAAVDFQLGMLPFSKLHSSTAPGVLSSNQFIPFGDFSPAAVSTSMVGFNHPLSSTVGVYSEMGGSSEAVTNTAHSSLASSIESLSSINQDLHWKLQQQRLAVYFGEAGAQRESRTVSAVPSTLMDDPQEPISFQAAENSRADQVCGRDGDSRAWFLGTSSYTVADTNTNMAANHNGINSSSDNNTNSWNGVAAWNDMHHFTALP